MKILVTGVAGFIGFHVAHKLIKKKYNVIGLDNLNNYYDQKLKLARLKELKKASKKNKNFKFFKIDICAEKKLKNLFIKNKFKKVLHFAAQAGVRFSLKKPEQYIQSNLVGFFNILNLCKSHKISHLVYASSSSVYGANKKIPFKESDGVNHPIQLYAATKRSNELMAHSYSALYKLPTTGIRFFTIYGPWGRPDMALYKFVKNILINKPIEIYNRGKHMRDFTYIDDAVNMIMKVLQKAPRQNKNNFKSDDPSKSFAPFNIINIGSNKPITLINYIKKIEKITGRKAHKKYLNLQKGDIIKTHANILKFNKIYSFTKKTNLNDGLKNFINWYKKYN